MNMKHIRVLLTLIFALISMMQVFAQRLGEEVVKEMVIEGKTVQKKMSFCQIKKYDKHGWLIREDWNYGYGVDNSEWKKYEYDTHGNLIKMTESKIPNIDNIYEYTFNSKGLVTCERSYTYNKSSKQYGKPGDTIREYDENGRKILQRTGNYAPRIYKYDAKGNLVFEGEDLNAGYFASQEYHDYDVYGQRIHTKTIYSNGNTMERWYKYDSVGNLIYDESSDGTIWIKEYNVIGDVTHQKFKYNGKWSENWYGYQREDIVYNISNDGYVIWYEYDYKPDGSKIQYTYQGR